MSVMEYKRSDRVRKANFSEDETLTLIEEISKERQTIMGKVPLQEKSEVWENISFKLNAMFGNDRTSHELKKKWKDLKARARFSKLQSNQTGEGHKDYIFSDYVFDIIGAEFERPTTNGKSDNHTEPETDSAKPGPPPVPDDDCSSLAETDVIVSFVDNESERVKKIVSTPRPMINQYKKRRKEQRESRRVDTMILEKQDLKIKWLKSEIAKNNSIVELNHHKIEYIKAKKAKLEV